MSLKQEEKELNRREFLRKGALVTAALPAAGAVISLWGCTRDEEKGMATISGSPQREAQPQQPAPGTPGSDDLRHVTEYPGNKAVLQALKYAEATPRKEERCDNCQFYAAGVGPKGMGKCQLIPMGVVKAEAWCSSWQPFVGS